MGRADKVEVGVGFVEGEEVSRVAVEEEGLVQEDNLLHIHEKLIFYQ
jgi:hypothetical protein